MIGLAVSTLRGRWPALTGAFAALALGAALAISAVSVIAAAGESVPRGPQRFRAAPIVVSGPSALRFAVGGEIESDPNPRRAALPAALATRVAALPAVRRVVVDRTFTVRTPAGAATVGHPWSMRLAAPYRLLAGRGPLAPDEVVVAAPGVALGRRVTLVTPGGPAPYRVVGIVSGGARYERPLFFTDAAAARLAPRVDALAIWPRSAAAAVRRSAGRAVVLTGAARGDAEHDPASDQIAGAGVLLGLMTMTVAFVATFAIASSFAFSVALRRRELALLRAVGATPRQIRRLVLREAALVALAAGVAGAFASLALAPLLGRWIVGRGLAPETLHVTPAPIALPVGAGAMLLVALVGAWAAARRAARVRPAEALRDAAVDRGVMTLGRWVIGVPAVAGAVALLFAGVDADAEAQLPLTLAQAALLIVGVATIAPLVVPRLVALLVPPTRGAGSLLVREHARSGVRRTAALAAPVLVAVALTGSLATMVNSIDASDRASTRARVAPDALVVTAAGDLSDDDVAALRAIPGATVGATAEADLRVKGAGGLTAVRTVGADPQALGLMLRVKAVAGAVGRLDGDAVALGELTARTLHKRVGDRIRVWLPDGTRRRHSLKVTAVLADGFASTGMYVARDVLAGEPASAVYARGSPAVFAAVARERGLELGGAGVPRPVADVTDSSHMNPLALLVILGVAVAYVAISLATTAAIGTVARAGELALLRLAGATRRDIVRLVAAEALVTTLVGGLLGCAITALVIAGIRHGLAGLEGPSAVALPWGLIAGVLAVFAAIAVTASALAAARSQRPAPHTLVPG